MTSDVRHRVVVLTPPGAGAIGVVRVVGPHSISIVNRAFRPASGAELSAAQSDRLRYGRFVDGEETIDDVIVSVTVLGRHEGKNVETPKRRNAETRGEGGTEARRQEGIGAASGNKRLAVDISAHGGVRVIERILQTLERLGAPVCEPAEVIGLAWPTSSLIEHEAVEALTQAKTERAVRFLAWQHGHLVDELEAVASLCPSDPAQAYARLAAMAQGYSMARTLIQGATVALVGPPNSGKSTLFNRLIGRPATVVSPRPGTTRDWVAEAVEMDGVPVTLVDTAGRCDAADALERLAVEAGRRAVERADVRVLLLDGSQPLPRAGVELLAASRPWSHCLTVINKSDAGSTWRSWEAGVQSEESGDAPLTISAATGAGCGELVSVILAMSGYRGWVENLPCLFTARQAEAAATVLSVLRRDPTAAEERLKRRLIGRCDEVTARGGGL